MWLPLTDPEGNTMLVNMDHVEIVDAYKAHDKPHVKARLYFPDYSNQTAWTPVQESIDDIWQMLHPERR